MSLVTILITLAVVGLLVYVLLQVPMPAPFKNVIIGVAILLMVLWLLKTIGMDLKI